MVSHHFSLFFFQTRSAWRYQPYTFIFPYPKPKAPQSQITVIQRGPLFWKVGVNVALGLGVADVCCRFGMAPFRIRPLHRYQISKTLHLSPLLLWELWKFKLRNHCFPDLTFVLECWSVRRPRAWRRGRMLPIWHGTIRIRPLHCNQISKALFKIAAL